MDKCKDCIHYEETYRYKGYCYLQDDYVKEDDTCQEFEEYK